MLKLQAILTKIITMFADSKLLLTNPVTLAADLVKLVNEDERTKAKKNAEKLVE